MKIVIFEDYNVDCCHLNKCKITGGGTKTFFSVDISKKKKKKKK